MTNDMNITIAPDAIIIAGERFPAVYKVAGTEKSARITVDINGNRGWFVVSDYQCAAESEVLAAVKAAAKGNTAEITGDAAEITMITLGDLKPCKVCEPRPADPAKQAHGDVPAKDWVNTYLVKEKDIEISFYGKTEIWFKDVPADRVIDKLKELGFHWSPARKVWSKGLNWKAYRAACKFRDWYLYGDEIKFEAC